MRHGTNSKRQTKNANSTVQADNPNGEKWALIFALRAGALALQRAAVRRHLRAGNYSGEEMDEAFAVANRKGVEADALLDEAERLVRQLNAEAVRP